MGLFGNLFKNKTHKTQKTYTNLGQKYVTEARVKTSTGSIKTTTKRRRLLAFVSQTTDFV
jgi:hypothetical protein